MIAIVASLIDGYVLLKNKKTMDFIKEINNIYGIKLEKELIDYILTNNLLSL